MITRKKILDISRTMVRDGGMTSINIRSVALACGVSVGTIYNYFDSKSDLTCAVTEHIWQDIFHHWKDGFVFDDTLTFTNWIYGRLQYGINTYPAFFVRHSCGFVHAEKREGISHMQQTWQHILDALSSVISRDPNVRANVFDDTFSIENFANIIFSLILASMIRNDYDATPILALIRRVLY